MRILIADDNVALQGVLAEVVSDAGHSVEVASSADGALSSIGSFRPDMILLDADMQEGHGLTLLDRMQNSVPSIDTPVIIIRSWNRQIPQDVPMVKGLIEKPFTAQDVMESMEKAQVGETEVRETPAVAPAAKQSDTDENASKETLANKGVSFGRSYVMFRSNSNEVHELISMFGNEGHDVLVVTTGKKKTVLRRIKSKNINILAMTIRLLGGRSNIYGLGTMIDNVNGFVKSNLRPVVAFDDLEQIIHRNGMNSTLTALHQLITSKYDRDLTFLVSVNPRGFTNKDKEILLKHMINRDPNGELA